MHFFPITVVFTSKIWFILFVLFNSRTERCHVDISQLNTAQINPAFSTVIKTNYICLLLWNVCVAVKQLLLKNMIQRAGCGLRTLVCSLLPKSGSSEFQITCSSIACDLTAIKATRSECDECPDDHRFSKPRGVSTTAPSAWRFLWSSSRCPRLPRAWPPPVFARWPPWSGRPSSAARLPPLLPDWRRRHWVSPSRRHDKKNVRPVRSLAFPKTVLT